MDANVPSAESALDVLSPSVRRWFVEHFGAPTAAQRLAWPRIVCGTHILLSSATGSGKTLAALLPILDRLAAEPAGGLRCLVVTPLKALCRDVGQNLKRHLRSLHRQAELPVESWHVGLRTGDTSMRQRRRQLVKPPRILITTPESLAQLLSQSAGKALFADLGWLVADEVHALVGTKRGADLALSMERLQAWTNHPLQRIGLSATCTPLELAARYLVGPSRPCEVVVSQEPRPLELAVEPLPLDEDASRFNFIAHLLDRLDRELARFRTTLIFTNTRTLAERVTWGLRRRYPDRHDEIAVHHSALAPARRRSVERHMKQGRLWAVVSSTSLELGIDMGHVDTVVFVHPPGGVVQMLQRLGRSGHRPGSSRHGLVLTATAPELLEATLTAESSRSGQIEALRTRPGPCDILCQHLAGLAMVDWQSPDEVFPFVRQAEPYEHLTREDFDACLDYLSGRHRDGTSWLPSRLQWNEDRFHIVDPRTARRLRMNFGSILSEVACEVRFKAEPEVEGSRIGEIDEIFAARLELGDRFMLDGRCLELKQRSFTAIHVDEVLGRPQVPRWQGQGVPMAHELARRLYLFRLELAEALRDGESSLTQILHADYHLGDAAIADLVHFLSQQEQMSEVPGLGHLLIEKVGSQSNTEWFVHTPLPRATNDTLARVVAWRWQQRFGGSPMTLAHNLGFLLATPTIAGLDAEIWREFLHPQRFSKDLHASLRAGDLLRDGFARVAQIGLMILRNKPGKQPRVGGRDWAQRQLFSQIESIAPDFILLRQALREAEQEICDLDAALDFVTQCHSLPIKIRPLAQPSPFGERFLFDAGSQAEVVVTPDAAQERLHAELFEARPV